MGPASQSPPCGCCGFCWDPMRRIGSRSVRSDRVVRAVAGPLPLYSRRDRDFLPAGYPERGEGSLSTNGTLLPMSHLELVEGVLCRGKLLRASYLDRVKQQTPQVYEAAQVLQRRFFAEAKSWPAMATVYGFLVAEEDKPRDEVERENAAYQKTTRALVEAICQCDVATLRAALAIDWLNDEPQAFGRKEIWRHAVREAAHGKEVCDSERDELRLILRQAGVGDPLIEQYLKSVPDDALQTGVGFPINAPDPWNYGSKTGDILTTDFILRYHCFDRGGMFPAYGMGFDQLKSLKPARLGEVLPAMLGSKDEQLSLVAHRAIERLPGTEFVRLLSERAWDGDSYALQALVVKSDREATNLRFKALLDLAPKWASIWSVLDSKRSSNRWRFALPPSLWNAWNNNRRKRRIRRPKSGTEFPWPTKSRPWNGIFEPRWKSLDSGKRIRSTPPNTRSGLKSIPTKTRRILSGETGFGNQLVTLDRLPASRVGIVADTNGTGVKPGGQNRVWHCRLSPCTAGRKAMLTPEDVA